MKPLKSRVPFTLTAAIVLSITACSLFTSKNVQTALDIAKVLCIVANAESDDQTVKTVCNIIDAEDDAFRSVLTEQRRASRRYAASKALSVQDGGVLCEAGAAR